MTANAYDSAGNLKEVTDPLGRVTTTEFDKVNRSVKTVDALGGETAFAYDAAGNQITVTDPRGFITRTEYDALNRPVKTVDALGGETTRGYDAAEQLVSVADALGRTSRTEYDALGRQAARVDVLGRRTLFAYDDAANRSSVTDPLGRTSVSEYDALDRLVSLTDPAGGVTQTVYDEVGNVLETVDPEGRTTRSVYDALGRVTESVDALGESTLFGYNARGEQTEVTDPLGRVTASAYDDLGRLVSATDPMSGVTAYGYDKVGNRTSLTDASGNATAFAYDKLNRLVSQTDELGHEARFAYDAAGNRVEAVDRNGRRTTFAFDGLNRRTGETWWVGGAAVYAAAFTHDKVGNVLTAADPSSSYSMTYDARNLLTGVDNQGTPAVPRVALTHTYDAAGQMTETRDDAGVTVTSTYDPRGLLASRAWSGGPSVRVEYARDGSGWVTGVTRSSGPGGAVPGVETEFEHDDRGAVTALRHLGPDGVTISGSEYEYDDAGQLAREEVDGELIDYEYDLRGQLVSVDRSVGADELFAYDATGNRTSGGGVAGPDNQLLEDAGFAYEYDAEGNRTKQTAKGTGEVTAYRYDHRNRLTGATRTSAGGVVLGEWGYTYDVYNRLLVRAEDGVTTVTVYDGQHAWADYAAGGAVGTRYLVGSGVDEVLARWRPGAGAAWYLADRQGSVRAVVDAGGAVISRAGYGAFGGVTSQTNPAARDRFLYTGRELAAGLGLYQYRARWYDPAAGRFTSRDPLGFAAGDTNLARYVGNSPTNYTDPSGMDSFVSRLLFKSKIVAPLAQGAGLPHYEPVTW